MKVKLNLGCIILMQIILFAANCAAAPTNNTEYTVGDGHCNGSVVIPIAFTFNGSSIEVKVEKQKYAISNCGENERRNVHSEEHDSDDKPDLTSDVATNREISYQSGMAVADELSKKLRRNITDVPNGGPFMSCEDIADLMREKVLENERRLGGVLKIQGTYNRIFDYKNLVLNCTYERLLGIKMDVSCICENEKIDLPDDEGNPSRLKIDMETLYSVDIIQSPPEKSSF